MARLIKTPMRILFLLTQDLESPAGSGRYFPLAKALVRQGNQVSINALHANFSNLTQTQFTQSGVEVHYVGQMHVRKIGDHKYYYPAHQLLPVVARATWALSAAALSQPADIVHIGKAQPMNGLAGMLAKRMRKRCVFLDCDDLEAANNTFSGTWQKKGVVYFEDRLPLQVDHVTTHTYYLRDRLLSLGVPAKKITYLPHGIDQERFSQTDPSQVEALRLSLGLNGKKVIAYIGSMSLGSHAVNLLLDAFSYVHHACPESVLLLVGGGEDLDSIRAHAQELQIGEYTLFTGRIHPSQIPLYYCLANVSVDPIPDNDSGRASLSLKMLESWASGVPLVTVDVGDRKMLLGSPPAGVLVQAENPRALADGIMQVLTNPETEELLRRRSTEKAALFSWEKLAENLTSVYEQVLFSQRIQT